MLTGPLLDPRTGTPLAEAEVQYRLKTFNETKGLIAAAEQLASMLIFGKCGHSPNTKACNCAECQPPDTKKWMTLAPTVRPEHADKIKACHLQATPGNLIGTFEALHKLLLNFTEKAYEAEAQIVAAV